MPKYNNLSILRRIDQHDLRSIRRVMTGLNHSFDFKNQHDLDAKDGRDMYMTANERHWANSILLAIRSNGDDYPLLREATERFIKFRLAPDSYVIEATKELDQLAEEEVLVVPVSHVKEYEEAVVRFYALPKVKIPERRQPINEDFYSSFSFNFAIKQRQNARGGPWKYMAGVDTSNAEVLRKLMAASYAILVGTEALNLTEEESKVLKAMLSKTHNNNLLQKMTAKWVSNFDQGDARILEATEVLKRDATNFVLKPKLYKVEYKLAEEAFEKDGWVFAGKVITSYQALEQEEKAREKRLIAREKKDAAAEKRLFVKPVEMKAKPVPKTVKKAATKTAKQSARKTVEKAAQKAAEKAQKVVCFEIEEEESSEDWEEDCENEDDEDFAPPGAAKLNKQCRRAKAKGKARK